MGLQTLTGDDTFVINDNPLIAESANGDIVTLDFPNDLVTLTTGKNKNTIYAVNEAGSNVDITCKVMRGGSKDKFLNNLLSSQERDFIAFSLMNGSFTKRLGDGQGNVAYDTYTLTGLVFTKKIGGKANTDGDGEQGTITYNIKGALATRGIV